MKRTAKKQMRAFFRKSVSVFTLLVFFSGIIGQDSAAAPVFSSHKGTISAEIAEPAEEMFGPDEIVIPEYLGAVAHSHVAHDSEKMIIHIQEAHCNYACQKKVAEIIEYLNSEYEISSVNLEGGAGEYDLSVFTRISDEDIRQRVAAYFVKEGLLSGAEYFAVNNPDEVSLWGIEDPGLYYDHLKTYIGSLSYRNEAQKHIRNIDHILDNLKNRMFSEEMLQFDKKYVSYKAGETDLREYLEWLFSLARKKLIDIREFNNVYLLSQTMEMEEEIDFRLANVERDEIMDLLKKRLSIVAKEDLAEKIFEFKNKRISPKGFYGYLLERAKERGLDLSEFTEFKKYLVYVSVYDVIERVNVMCELDEIETLLRGEISQSSEELELSVLSKKLRLLENLFELRFTKEDYVHYIENRASFYVQGFTSFIERYAPQYGIRARPGGRVEDLDRYREEQVRFYEYAFKRDEAFVQNLSFEDPGPERSIERAAIMVTGGFHAENLVELFKEQGISVVSIMPQFKSSPEKQNSYFALLEGKSNQVFGKIQDFTVSALAIASFLNENINAVLNDRAQMRIAFDLMVEWRTKKEQHKSGQLEGKEGIVIQYGDRFLALYWTGEASESSMVDEKRFEVVSVGHFSDAEDHAWHGSPRRDPSGVDEQDRSERADFQDTISGLFGGEDGVDAVMAGLQEARVNNREEHEALIRGVLSLLRKAGLSPVRAEEMIDRILLVDIDSDELEFEAEAVSGMVVPHEGKMRILVTKRSFQDILHRGIEGSEKLGNLLQELVRVDLLESGLSVEKANNLSEQLRKAWDMYGMESALEFMLKLEGLRHLMSIMNRGLLSLESADDAGIVLNRYDSMGTLAIVRSWLKANEFYAWISDSALLDELEQRFPGLSRNLSSKLPGSPFLRGTIIRLFKQFFSRKYEAYLRDLVRDLMGPDIARSPVLTPSERKGDSSQFSFAKYIERYGREEIERRLRATALILMESDKDLEQVTYEDAIGADGGWAEEMRILSFERLAPEMIAAIFVPEGIYEVIKNNVPSAFQEKIVKVRGEVKANSIKTEAGELFWSRDSLGDMDVNMPDWFDALYDFIEGNNRDLKRTLFMHGTRLPIVWEMTGKEAPDKDHPTEEDGPVDIIGAMHEGRDSWKSDRRLEALRRLLKRKGIDIQKWATDQLSEVTRKDKENLKKALSAIGITGKRAQKLEEKIIPVDLPEEIGRSIGLDRPGRPRIGAVIVNLGGELRVLIQKHRLENAEELTLKDLVHEIAELELLEKGMNVDEAHYHAERAKEAWVREGISGLESVLSELRDNLRVGRIEAQFAEVMKEVLEFNGIDEAKALEKLSEEELQQIRTRFVEVLESGGTWLVAPSRREKFVSILETFLTRENMRNMADAFGDEHSAEETFRIRGVQMKAGDLNLIFERLHTLAFRLEEFGLKGIPLEEFVHPRLFHNLFFSNAQKFRMLQEAGLDPKTMPEPDPEVMRLLEKRAFVEVLDRFFEGRSFPEVFPAISAICKFFDIDMARMGNNLLMNFARGLEELTGDFVENSSSHAISLGPGSQMVASEFKRRIIRQNLIDDALVRILLLAAHLDEMGVQVKRFLGKGADGQVFEGTGPRSQKIVVKMNNPRDERDNKRFSNKLEKFGKGLKTSEHDHSRHFPNIIGILNFPNWFGSEDPRSIIVEVNEFIDGVELRDIVDRPQLWGVQMEDILELFVQVLNVQDFLLSEWGKVDRDVKNSTNFVVDRKGRLRFVDFGNINDLSESGDAEKQKRIQEHRNDVAVLAVRMIFGMMFESLEGTERDFEILADAFADRFGENNRHLGKEIFGVLLEFLSDETISLAQLSEKMQNTIERRGPPGSLPGGIVGAMHEFDRDQQVGEEVDRAFDDLKKMVEEYREGNFSNDDIDEFKRLTDILLTIPDSVVRQHIARLNKADVDGAMEDFSSHEGVLAQLVGMHERFEIMALKDRGVPVDQDMRGTENEFGEAHAEASFFEAIYLALQARASGKDLSAQNFMSFRPADFMQFNMVPVTGTNEDDIVRKLGRDEKHEPAAETVLEVIDHYIANDLIPQGITPETYQKRAWNKYIFQRLLLSSRHSDLKEKFGEFYPMLLLRILNVLENEMYEKFSELSPEDLKAGVGGVLDSIERFIAGRGDFWDFFIVKEEGELNFSLFEKYDFRIRKGVYSGSDIEGLRALIGDVLSDLKRSSLAERFLSEHFYPLLQSEKSRAELLRKMLDMVGGKDPDMVIRAIGDLPADKIKERAELTMALRTTFAAEAMRHVNALDLNIVAQVAPQGGQSAASGPMQAAGRRLDRSYSGVSGRSIIREGDREGRMSEHGYSGLIDSALVSLSDTRQEKARCLFMVPHEDRERFESAAENKGILKNGEYRDDIRVQFIDQGRSPDLFTQFLLGVLVLDHDRKGPGQEASPSLKRLLSTMVENIKIDGRRMDVDDPAAILEKLFQGSVLVMRRVDWDTFGNKYRAWKALATSL